MYKQYIKRHIKWWKVLLVFNGFLRRIYISILRWNKVPHWCWKQSLFLLSFIGIILRWGFLIWELIFFYLLRTFCPHLGSFFFVCFFFLLFLLSLRFGQISPLASFRWFFTATSDRNDESCNRIPSNYCLPIRGCSKITWRRPELKFGRNVVKEETTQKKKKKNYQDEDKKSAINKKKN